MKWSLFWVLLLAGCQPAIATPAFRPGVGSAIVGFAAMVPDRDPSTVSKECAACNGRGTVGDGATVLTCQACGGDGIAKPSEFVLKARGQVDKVQSLPSS